MSAEATGWVYRHCPFKGATFQVHHAIADSVNDQHDNEFWMAQANLATKARCGGRAVTDAVAALHEGGFIEPVDPAMADPEARRSAGGPTRWRFLFPEDAAVVYESRRSARAAEGGTHSVRRGATGVRTGSAPAANVTQGDPKPDTQGPAGGGSAKSGTTSRKTDPRSDALTRAWWEAQSPRPTWNYLAARGIVSTALKQGWTEDQVRAALATLPPPFTSGQLEYALRNPRRAVRAEHAGTAGMGDDETGRVVAL